MQTSCFGWPGLLPRALLGCRRLGLPRAPLHPGPARPAAPGHTGAGTGAGGTSPPDGTAHAAFPPQLRWGPCSRAQRRAAGGHRRGVVRGGHRRLFKSPSAGRELLGSATPGTQLGLGNRALRAGCRSQEVQSPCRQRAGSAGGDPEGSRTRGGVTVNRTACASRTRLLRRRGRTDTRAEDARTRVPGTPCWHRARWHLSNPTPSFSPSQLVEPPAPVSPQLCPAPSIRPSVRACVYVCVSVSEGWAAARPVSLRRIPALRGRRAAFPPLSQEFSFSLLYFPFLSPLVSGRCSDLDRDFWNNNDNTVQQKWSSYPPKEFILNISPYAPYGDPRLSLK